MKKLFLTSSFVDVSEFLEPFADEPLKGKTITFIPTASVPEEYKDYVENDRKALENLGLVITELDISAVVAKKAEEMIRMNNFIYVSGGNTFYLLQELKKFGIDKVIVDEIEKGKLYIGASAGSIVLSKNIKYVEKMDDASKAKELSDFSALNKVDFYTLPHYTSEPFKNIVEEIIAEYKTLNLMPISNTQVIQVEGNRHEVKGNE